MQCSIKVHLKLCNINLHNVTHSLISWNLREWMFLVQISLLTVTFHSLIPRNLSLMQTTKEVNPHPRIASCVNMWSVFFFFFFFLCPLLNVGACVFHIAWEGQVEWTTLGVGDRRTNSNCPHISFVIFHSVTCYTNSMVSRIHVNTTKLCNITCTLVATCLILRSLECIWGLAETMHEVIEGNYCHLHPNFNHP
jgi:hypothetical protein